MMRIAQVAPLSEAIPPKLYGGSERVVSWLTEELVRQGHDVTLFASGDSITSAKLVPGAPKGLRLSGIKDHLASHLVMLSDVRRRETEFDIIHFHTDLLQYPIFEHMGDRTVTTMHGRLDLPDYMPAYRRFPGMPRVSISDAQRIPTPQNTNWVSTVYHGLPDGLCPFDAKGGGYLAFLGRISPEKRPDRAIEIAKRSGIPLKIAAKVDHVDTAYFEDLIKPMLDDPLIEFIGEINDREKADFLANALALLFPIDWAEPFGLVMIEAMSAGTPVVAWRNGSVPEIITPGRSGFIVDSVSDAVAAVESIGTLDRRIVRQEFEERFTVDKMAAKYIAIYAKLAEEAATGAPAERHAPSPRMNGHAVTDIHAGDQTLPAAAE
jgi:glycosyltransferase involved in cell wall biosynthesis